MLATTSCIDNDFVFNGKLGEGETMAKLSFGHNSYEEIKIESRATLNEVAESHIYNLFVFVFDQNGKRVYSEYFDEKNKVNQLPNEVANYWTVENHTSSNLNDTHGEVLMKVPILENGSIHIVANLNADLMNISPDQLLLIETLSDLNELTVTLSQEITSRSYGFLMSGSANNINIADNGNITQNGNNVMVNLDRLDAKVSVKIALGTDSTKIPEGITLKRFIPDSWQVKRLPRGCKIIEKEGSNADHLGFFDTEELFFETADETGFGFSFYVMENKKSASGLTNYHQREERIKKADGSYDTEKGVWKHVDDNATYMIIKGRLQITEQTDPDNIFAMQYLEADVTYYIHLGNFGSSEHGGDYNDFAANRNTHYIYKIAIYGVDNIVVEVEHDRENQSGATGNVYKSREEIFTYDAHYGQRVYCIDAEDVNDSTLTWYVKTPFGEGRPGLEFGTENPNLDYKWAWFKVNPIDNTTGMYSQNNQWYPGDQYQTINELPGDDLWNVNEFVEWLRAEKIKLRTAPDSQKNTASAFQPDKYGRYCIYVTVFVDENYYEAHPLTGEGNTELWKQFVNKPHRIMHILCESLHSKDLESSLTNSIITLRQRSIQSVYNTNKEDLKTAWGCETIDEFIQSQLFYYDNNEEVDVPLSYANSIKLGYLGEPSVHNGLYNSLKMWGITPEITRWDEHFDYERVNDYESNMTNTVTHFIVDNSNKTTLRYSSLMRNRDNNGDGIINEEELRWYVATLPQLYDLFIGQLGIDKEAYLYTSEMEMKPNAPFTEGNYVSASGIAPYEWRLHIIPSTWVNRNGYSRPQVLWAEESFSLSYYQQTADWGNATLYAPLSTRCVRNLGISTPTIYEEGVNGVNYPEELVKVTYNANSDSYIFDFHNLNKKSIRFYTSHELEIEDENNEISKVYYGFETGKPFQLYSGTGGNNKDNYDNLVADLEAGKILCPTGYRVPTVREGALMSLYCSQNWWAKLSGTQYALVSTTYSNGIYGRIANNKSTNSWQFGYKFATLGAGGAYNIVPVRDIKQ